MSTEPNIAPQTLVAEAQRQRTFRRWIAGITCIVVAFIAVRIVWGIVASNRLQAEIDRIHAEGQPIFAHEFPAPRSLPADQNAADYYRRAYAAIDNRDHGELTFLDALNYPRAHEKYPEELETIVLSNQKVVDIARQARAIPDTDWSIQVATPIIDTRLGFLSEVRQVASVLRMTALYRLRRHENGEALGIINDMLLLADRLQQTDSYCPVVNVLVALALQHQSCSVLEMMTPAVPIGEQSDNVADGAIPRKHIVALIRRLLDEKVQWKSYDKARCVDRAASVDAIDGILRSASPFSQDPFSYLYAILVIKPAWQLDTVRLIRHSDGARRAGMTGSWSTVAAYDEFANPDDEQNPLQVMAHYPSNMFGSSRNRSTALIYRNLVMRRMAAIALTIRLFEIDHGHRPTTLAELVPKYLDAIPIDPFDKDAGPIRYLPDASPPLLYSVNTNQRDEGGKYMSVGDKITNHEDFDIVYFLNGDRPHPEMPEE